jgi:hypothetical protein
MFRKNKAFEYHGNHLGICIENGDPEYRGRVKIFIPHIMPALYENWNQAGLDLTIDCVGNNLQNGLDSSIIDRLREILPWAECASPVFGTSTSGTYNPTTGTYNQTSYTAADPGVDPSTFNYNLDANIDENLAKYVMSIGARETSLDSKQANDDYYNAVETVDGKSYRNANVARGVQKEGLTLAQAQAKYGDYGFFQTNQNDVEHAVRLGVPRDVASAMNNGGGRGNYSLEEQARATALYIKAYRPEAAEAAARGDWDTANAILKGKWPSLPGGRSHRSGQDGKANAFLKSSKPTPDLNDPASDPDPSSLPPPPIPQRSPEGGDYTTNSELPAPSVRVQATDTNASPPSGSSSGNFASAFKTNVLKGSSGLRSNKGTTLCGVGTRKAVGLALGDSYYSNTGFGTDYTSQTVNTGYWTKKGDFTNEGTVGSGYKPQQGDVLIHKLNKGGTAYGHAQVYLDGQWHSWKSGDDVNGYLNKSGQQTTLMRLTDQGKQKLTTAGVADTSTLGVDGALSPATNRKNDENNGAEADYTTNISKHTTETQVTPIDTTGMAQGVFSVPCPGALLWVFFREGNPLYPVYFAASYGANEWGSVYMRQSPPAFYPKDQDISPINNEAVLRPNSAGLIKFNGTVTKDKDYRSVKLAHACGGCYELHATGTIHYSPNEHVEQIGGNRFSYCLNREEWTQGTDNRVTIGNQFIVIGTPTQTNIETIERLTEKVKKINEEMLKD